MICMIIINITTFILWQFIITQSFIFHALQKQTAQFVLYLSSYKLQGRSMFSFKKQQTIKQSLYKQKPLSLSSSIQDVKDEIQLQSQDIFEDFQDIKTNQNQQQIAWNQLQMDNLQDYQWNYVQDQSQDENQHTQDVNCSQIYTPYNQKPAVQISNTISHTTKVLKGKQKGKQKEKEKEKEQPKRRRGRPIAALRHIIHDQKSECSEDDTQLSVIEGHNISPKKDITLQFLAKANQFFHVYSKNQEIGNITSENSLRNFAFGHGYTRSSVYYLYKKWQQNHNLVRVQQAIINGTFNSNFRGKSKVTNQRLDIIYKILDHNPLLHANQVAQIIQKDPKCVRIDSSGNPISLNHKAIVRIYNSQKLRRIRLRLISSIRNRPQDLQRRKYYCQNLLKALQNNQKVFYIDEMIINRWVGRQRAWGRQGQSFVNVMVNLKKQSFLLVAIMNDQGTVKFEVIHGNSPHQKYNQVLERLLTKTSDKSPNDKKVLVIHAAVGNQTKHMMKQVGQNKGFCILMLPPYSSQLNPLESWFLQIRTLLKRQRFNNDLQLINIARKIINVDLKARPLPDFIAGIEKYITKGLSGLYF